MDNQRSLTVEEVAMLLGAKVIEIHALQKHIGVLEKRIAELEQPKEESTVP